MILAFIEGDFNLPLACQNDHVPDIVTMCEDIERATRELHGGRFIMIVSDQMGPDIRMSFGFLPWSHND